MLGVEKPGGGEKDTLVAAKCTATCEIGKDLTEHTHEIVNLNIIFVAQASNK